MENIKEYDAGKCALLLIKEHNIGLTFRDESDLSNAKYSALITINFIEYLLSNIDGSIDDKVKFILKIKEEIPKFKGKQKHE